MSATAADAERRASALLLGDADAAAGLDDGELLALAWALKHRCYGAWSSEPPLASSAAQALDTLRRPAEGRAVAGDIDALADWTAGIAALVRGEMEAALDALDRSGRHWRLHGQPLHAAHTRVPCVMALAMLARFDDAQACGETARRDLVAAGDTLAAARVSLNLGSLAGQRGRFADALPLYRDAARLFAQAGDREHSVMADIGCADALCWVGQFDEAARVYDRAAMRARTHGLPVLAASADNGRAILDLSCGRFQRALAGLERSRQAFTDLGLGALQFEAEKSLADAYLELRLWPEATRLYAALAESSRTAESPTLPWVQLQLAQALALQGRSTPALSALDRAEAGFETQDHAIGRASVMLARACWLAGTSRTDPGAAAELAQRAGAGFAAQGVGHLAQSAQVQEAAFQVAARNLDRAAALCEALTRQDTLTPLLRVQAQAVHAEALLGMGRTDDARAMLDAVTGDIEDLRGELPGDDLRRAFLADLLQPFRRRLGLALDDVQAGRAPPLEAWQWLERVRARALAERLPGDKPSADRVQPDHLQPHELRTRLDWLYRRQIQSVEQDGAAPEALRDETMRLEAELLESARRQRLLLAADATQRPRVEADLAQLQSTLGDDGAVVAYGVHGDELFALTLTPEGARLHRGLARWSETVPAIRRLRFQIDTLRAGEQALAGPMRQVLERLRARLADVHARIWAPLAATLQPCTRLLVMPHGALHGVPFAALEADSGPLIETHEIAIAPSLAVAARGVLRQPGPSRRPLLVADTQRLAHAAAEVAGVQVVLPDATVLAGAKANVAEFLHHAGGSTRVHIACHARFRQDNPLFSALQLADARLAALDIEALSLPAGLVVLSGCETAVGDVGECEEGLGLVRAFLIAGAARVVGSLWPVDDAATADLMVAFHRALAGGASAAAALRQAQLAQRARLPHPYHWAGFAVHGGR